ncbi:response regulator [Xylophilus sp. Kf1]|nr:response regulator [Xylophilus sp. Kf1]
MDVVVGEDDLVQRERLARMVALLRPEWTQVAHVSSADGVIAALADFRPDILLLDIHLGSEDPGWIRRLPRDVVIIFITGDPTLAVDAFDLAAVDYLVKPLLHARLEKAFQRAERRLVERIGDRGPPAALQTVVAARGSELVMFHVDEICYLQSDNKYTRLVSATQNGLARTSIAQFERRLDPRFFKRIHRGTLVNLRQVQRVWRDETGRLRVQLPCPGDDLQVSRTFESVFRVF